MSHRTSASTSTSAPVPSPSPSSPAPPPGTYITKTEALLLAWDVNPLTYVRAMPKSVPVPMHGSDGKRLTDAERALAVAYTDKKFLAPRSLPVAAI